MVNFKQLVLKYDEGTTFINLEKVKTWSLGIKEVTRDEESLTFKIRIKVDGVEYLATHKFLKDISEDEYSNLEHSILNGNNFSHFKCLKCDGCSLEVQMNHICNEYIVTNSFYSIGGMRPKRPNPDRSKDVFDEVEFEGIEEEH